MQNDRKSTFAANLRFAIKKKGVKMGKIVEELGWGRTEYEWLRKITTTGLSRVTRRKAWQLAELCEYLGFGFYDADWLWEKPEDFQNALGIERKYLTCVDWRSLYKFNSNYGLMIHELERKFTGYNVAMRVVLDQIPKPLEAMGFTPKEAFSLTAWFWDVNRLDDWDLHSKTALYELGMSIAGGEELEKPRQQPVTQQPTTQVVQQPVCFDPGEVEGMKFGWRWVRTHMAYASSHDESEDQEPQSDDGDPIFAEYFTEVEKEDDLDLFDF